LTESCLNDKNSPLKNRSNINAVSVSDYSPFGVELANRSWSVEEYRSGFNTQEKVPEIAAGHTTAMFWEYDAPLGRRWQLDPKTNTSISSYACFANSPILFSDAKGDTIFVLTAPQGAGGAGHMAILIQNKDNTWSLYSKNGTGQYSGSSGPNDKGDNKGSGKYKSPQEFLESKDNPFIEGEREYTEGYLIYTSTKQDKEAIKGFFEVEREDYNILTSNCAQAVQSALKRANMNDGTISKFEFLTKKLVSDTWALYEANSPNRKYERIKEQNPGGEIITPKVLKKKT
jgi:hypothetical protein